MAGLRADGLSFRGIADGLRRRRRPSPGGSVATRRTAACAGRTWRTDRRWLATYAMERLAGIWKPEQIAGRLRLGIQAGIHGVCTEMIYGWIHRAGRKTERPWLLLTHRHARRRPRHVRESRDTTAEIDRTTRLSAAAVALIGLAGCAEVTGSAMPAGDPERFATMVDPCAALAARLTGISENAITATGSSMTMNGLPILMLSADGGSYVCRQERDGGGTVFSELANGDSVTPSVTAPITGAKDALAPQNVLATAQEDETVPILSASGDPNRFVGYILNIDNYSMFSKEKDVFNDAFTLDPEGAPGVFIIDEGATDNFFYTDDNAQEAGNATPTIAGIAWPVKAVNDRARMYTRDAGTREINVLRNDIGIGLKVAKLGDQTQITADGGYWVAGSDGGHFRVSQGGRAAFFDEGAFDGMTLGDTITSSVDYVVINERGVADTATLTVTIMPDPHRIGDPTFIENRGKIGLGVHEVMPPGYESEMEYYNTLDAGWYYDWWHSPVAGATDMDFVPMMWGDHVTTDALQEAVANSTTGELLGFNEPDITNQANMTVERAIKLWSSLETTGLRLGSPATGRRVLSDDSWFARFMAEAKAKDLRVDFIALHPYTTNPDVDALEDYIISVYEKYKLPIWITEFALVDFGDWSRFRYEDNAKFMISGFPDARRSVFCRALCLVCPGPERRRARHRNELPRSRRQPYRCRRGLC